MEAWTTRLSRSEIERRAGDPLAFYSVECHSMKSNPPTDLVLVLDASGSLAGPPRRRAAAALRTLVGSLSDERRVALVLATEPAQVVTPLAPLAAARDAIDSVLARSPAGGAATLARALDLASLEVRRSGPAATVVLVSDLAWSAAEPSALARLDATGAALILVEATSAFTPPMPARTPRLTLPLPISEDDTAPLEVARALADLVQAGTGSLGADSGWLEIELLRAPVAWFTGEPLEACAEGATTRARVPLEGARARLAFATRDTSPVLGEARLVLSPESAPRRLVIDRQQATVLERAPALAVAPVGNGATA